MQIGMLSRIREFARHAAPIAAFTAAFWGQYALADGPHTNGAGPDGRLNVVLDEAKLVKLPERVATIVIGNPLIADASLQAGNLMVLTGKGYGATNLIALDRRGNALLEKTVQVHGPERNVITVYKGVNRETWSCAPNCQPRITPGDFQQFFAQTLAQTVTRNTQALATTK
jgi:hypothetical protein